MKPPEFFIETSNMAEVLYLLDRRHSITDVRTRLCWPYDVLELCVTMKGEHIGLDHQNFISEGSCDLDRLPVAFDAVMQAIWKKNEDDFMRSQK